MKKIACKYLKIKIIFGVLLFTVQAFCQVNINTIEIDSNLSLRSKIEKFNPAEHKIDSCDSGTGWAGVCLIDGKPVFGTDYGIPNYQIIELIAIIDGVEIPLETDYMFSTIKFIRIQQIAIKKADIGILIYGWFGDGAGAYVVCWKIINNKAYRLVITTDEDFFKWFEK